MQRHKPFNLDVSEATRAAVSENTFKVFAKDGDEVEIQIIDEIGDEFYGVTAKDVRKLVKDSSGKPINLVVNSPGGLVYDGLQIFNSLISHDAPVTATVEGLAYSAASFVVMAADRVRMYENSDLGIHRAWGVAVGNQKVMRDVADWLGTIDEHLLDIYEAKSGQPRGRLEAWLDGDVDGTLFSAKAAVEAGLADEVIPMPRRDSSNSIATQKQSLAALKIRDAKIKNLTRLA